MRPVSFWQVVRGAAQAARFAVGVHQYLKAQQPPPPVDPMAGLASGDELARYSMQRGAFFLGTIHPDHGATFPAGVLDDRHVFIVAGSRAGKGLTLGIPNALTWPGPLLAIDPKGEMASIAALRRASAEAAKGTGTSVRHFLGQDVAILDPLGQVRGPARAFTVKYNPLDDIDMTRGGGVRAIRAVASSLIKPDANVGAHFSESAETLTAGLLEAVKLLEAPDRQTLTACFDWLQDDKDALRDFLASVDRPGGLAREAVSIMDQVGGEEWGSFRSTLSRNWKWLAEPDMQAHVAPSSFSLRRAVQDGASVFICLPPEVIADFASWLRVIVRVAIDAKIALGTDQRGPQTLCLLDEFPQLGRFKSIEDSAGYMAGYGLKLVPIIQNIGQVRAHYANNWETFLGNAGAIIAFGLNDFETEQYFSNRLGRVMIDEGSVSHSASGMSGGHSVNVARHERPVRFPNEIHEQGARETGRAFVIPAAGRGFTVLRQPYPACPSGTFDSPDFISEWERRFWRFGTHNEQ